MALSKIDVANMLTGATPVANGGTALTSGFVNGRTNNQGLPIIVNGDMAVAQRSSSTVAQADDSNEGYATVDRFAIKFSNSAGGTITTSRDTTTTTGFGQSIKLNVTGADTSVASTHIVDLHQTIEAQVIRNSGWNYTSSSSYLTLSFHIRSSKTGTYCVFFQTNDGTAQMYTAEYTISSADTFEQKIISVPGNSNLQFDNDTGIGLRVGFILAVGTDRDGTAGSWTSGNAFGTSNQVNFLDSTDNIAYITGVQLEVGQFTSSTLPAFQHESFGDNYRRCQRYCYQITSDSSVDTDIISMTGTGGAAFGAFRFPVQMRSAPTVSDSGDSDFSLFGDTSGTPSSLRGDRTNSNSTGIVSDTSVSAGDSVNLRLDSDSGNKFLRFDAELE
jgi:hypothetical protein